VNISGDKMKKLTFIILAIMIGTVACDSDSDQLSQEVNPVETTTAETAITETAAADNEVSLITPGDLPEEAQNTMYKMLYEYNQCMMIGRLKANQGGQSVQQAADEIMASCEGHMDTLKAHLLAHNVNKSLVEGMTKKMRSRAARKMMTQGMNQMAAQAAAVVNAEEAKAAESAPAE
jgi:hypothetical protein